MPSTIAPRETPARDDVLPAGGRRRSPASVEVRDAPAGARDRNARARAARPEVAAHGSPAHAADAGVDPPRPLPRPPGPQARRRAARAARARPALAASALPVEPRARAGRERRLEPDRDSGGGADREVRGHRRRSDDFPAELRPPDRSGGQAHDGGALGRGPP